jgi:hypothetical protein
MNMTTKIRQVFGSELACNLVLALFFVAVIAAFDWTDYHARGNSAFIGVNPRCAIQFNNYCFKIENTTNLPWHATVALWLGQGLWFFVITIAVVSIGTGALLLTRAAIRRLLH